MKTKPYKAEDFLCPKCKGENINWIDTYQDVDAEWDIFKCLDCGNIFDDNDGILKEQGGKNES